MSHVLRSIANNLTTNYAVHRFPSKLDSSEAGQEIRGFSWNTKAHYRVHMNQLL
jgi:hypothetical protein